MREEVISSGTVEALALARSSSPPLTPAASSAAASSHVPAVNAGSTNWLGSAQGSKAGSLSSAAAHRISLSYTVSNSTLGSSEILCRPWERGDLLRRLATFEPSNWFTKPKGTSSLACARRGWVSVGNGKIECEICHLCLIFNESTPRTVEAISEKLDSGHKPMCPWKGNCCADSLVQFPPTPASALIGSYKDRCDGLLQFPYLPIIASSAIEFMKLSRSVQIERILSQPLFSLGEMAFKADNMPMPEMSREDPIFHHTQAQKLISLCGWEPRWLPNVQDCEEGSAESARNACSFGPNEDGYHHKRYPELSKYALSASVEKKGKEKLLQDSKCNMRSPLLDCSLCGATVRVWDFLTVSQLARLGPNNISSTVNCKRLVPTQGNSAASGINGCIGANGVEEEQVEDRDEAVTTAEKKSHPNADVSLILKITERFPSTIPIEVDPLDDVCMGRDLTIGQPAGSEVGDRAASFESRGPSSRKRSLEEGGSTVDRPQDRIHQADSIEGTVVNRDDDEVDEGTHDSGGLSKRARGLEALNSQDLSHKMNKSGVGPSHGYGYHGMSISRQISFKEGSNQATGDPSTRNSAHASSVVAMDTIFHSDDENSMESVENCPGDVDYLNFSFTNGPSEFENSNLVQTTWLPHAGSVAREMGGSSTIEGEEVLNAETLTTNAKDILSLGISGGGSVGMGASHEAEVHGIDAYVPRTYSALGEAGLIAEVTENLGQSGESAEGPGLMDNFLADEVLKEFPHSDMQDMMSRSVAKADSGSKVYGSIKADSIESGGKMSRTFAHESSAHPSLSCNAMVCSAYEISMGEVMQTGKETIANDCAMGSGIAVGNSSGPQNEESNYKQEAGEFNPIKHHNINCPWVNGNVAAAGFNMEISFSTAALSGWQLTLDALDTFQSLGQIPNQMMESESAASLYKDDHLTPNRKF